MRSGTFFKESIERNKALFAKEEATIKQIIKNDSLNKYFASENGFWYRYIAQDTTSTLYPEVDDIVVFQYEVQDLNNATIYSKEELGLRTYKVDKEDLMPGLRNGIKLMNVGETVTFLFPSHMAYGYHGDDDKIGINVPLKSTVTLLELKKTEQ